MNLRLRGGKSSELIVAGELLRKGIDVYLPCVDDQAIDLLVRAEKGGLVRHYDVQVKSVEGYNRIIGIKKGGLKNRRSILVVHYRHLDRPDEFFYLTREQVAKHHLADSDWGDLVFNKDERRLYSRQTLEYLAQKIINAKL